jgi:hypothetical protein
VKSYKPQVQSDRLCYSLVSLTKWFSPSRLECVCVCVCVCVCECGWVMKLYVTLALSASNRELWICLVGRCDQVSSLACSPVYNALFGQPTLIYQACISYVSAG